MSSFLKNRFGIPGVISIVALVFAMAGGAYAAKKYVITSTSQIKPSVLKSLQGKPGPAGAAGAKGDTGAAGAAGSKGDAGGQGNAGANGTSVTTTTLQPGQEGCAQGGVLVNSASGSQPVCNGEEGSPWTELGTLPEGKTETGTWTMGGRVDVSGFVKYRGPISFSIPLSEADAAGTTINVLALGEGETPECPGTAAHPEAAPGAFCLYTTEYSEFLSPAPSVVEPEQIAAGAEGLSTGGAIVVAAALGEKTTGAAGSWAVTAAEG
jgi:hypothetical protein